MLQLKSDLTVIETKKILQKSVVALNNTEKKQFSYAINANMAVMDNLS